MAQPNPDDGNESGQVALTQFPSNTDSPVVTDDLPERSFQWATEPTTVGDEQLSVIYPDDDVTLNDRYLSLGSGGYIVGDTDAYLDEHADQSLDIPSTYTAMDDFSVYVGTATTLGSGYGRGIGSWLVEMAVRLATGGGRYNTDNLTLIACGSNPFVIRSPDGDFLLQTNTVGEPADFEPPEARLGPICIEEEDERVIEGMKQLLTDAQTYFGINPTEYAGRSSMSHRVVFDGDDADQCRISGGDCYTRHQITTDPTDVLRTYEIETEYGEHFECRLDRTELAYAVGDDCRDGICIGYSTGVHDPRQSARASMSGRIKAYIQYHYLTHRESRRPELDLRTKKETIAEFDTENESYQPIESHL